MKRIRHGLLPQVVLLFTVAILVTGVITFFIQREISAISVRRQTEAHGEQVAEETRQAVWEFPASDWLLQYWYTHSAEMDVPYDETFRAGTVTWEKARLLERRYPDLQLRYADEETLSAFPPEDQKLYAEVAYSWLITRINQIQAAYGVTYLFCVVTEPPYMNQFFLFSANAAGRERGEEYLQVYRLGKTVSLENNISQHNAMVGVMQNDSHLEGQGSYVDYYSVLSRLDDHVIMIGMTYDVSELNETAWRFSKHQIFAVMLFLVLLAVICIVMVDIFVLHPLRKVQGNIRLYAHTKDSRTVAKNLSAIRLHNEIGQLSADVSAMVEEIDDYVNRIRTITAEKERASAEIALAARIQADMLPQNKPEIRERRDIDIDALMDPAREVGGDFYDYFLLDEDHLVLVMADVSGKGIPAALFMMAAMILVRNHIRAGTGPGKALEIINNQICGNNREQMFVTVWLGILDLNTGILTAANAGHEYPVFRRPGERFELMKDKHGFVVGGLKNVRYREYTVEISPGASIFLYTDGVPEATDAGERLFGTERMLEALNAAPDASPEELLARVRSAVDSFVGDAPQFDDLTMLCLRYNGKGDAP